LLPDSSQKSPPTSLHIFRLVYHTAVCPHYPPLKIANLKKKIYQNQHTSVAFTNLANYSYIALGSLKQTSEQIHVSLNLFLKQSKRHLAYN